MFRTKAGIELIGVKSTALLQMRQMLIEEFGISWTQFVEASSYSMAMVVRFALGLSAEGGRVACIFDDTLSGWVALATIRHLVNAGSEAELIFIGDLAKASEELERQLKTLDRMGVPVTVWSNPDESSSIASILGNCHNSLCGYFELGRPISEFEKVINDLLNELSTPIYAVECPPGVDPDTGKSQGSPLFASCTLSLGAPLEGLFHGSDYVGRHYLCDTSLTKEIYGKYGTDLTAVYADQPVQQIFPIKEQE